MLNDVYNILLRFSLVQCFDVNGIELIIVMMSEDILKLRTGLRSTRNKVRAVRYVPSASRGLSSR